LKSTIDDPVIGGVSPPSADLNANRLALHVEEQGRRSAALGLESLPLLRNFARFLAVLAAHGKWQRAQAALGNLLAALEAVAERAFLEPAKRFLDLVERFRFHLDERELDIVLNVGLGRLGCIQHTVCRTVRPFRAYVSNLLVHLAQDFATTLLEYPLQLRVPIAGHLSARCFINAHMIAAPFRLVPFRVAARYANELPLIKPKSLHRINVFGKDFERDLAGVA
jgi:hypothetical protein